MLPYTAITVICEGQANWAAHSSPQAGLPQLYNKTIAFPILTFCQNGRLRIWPPQNPKQLEKFSPFERTRPGSAWRQSSFAITPEYAICSAFVNLVQCRSTVRRNFYRGCPTQFWSHGPFAACAPTHLFVNTACRFPQDARQRKCRHR